MGIRFRAVVHADDRNEAALALARGWQKVDELNQLLSDYLADNVIAELAKTAPHAEPVPVDPGLFELVARSVEFSRQTGGAFDITAGPASQLWRAAIRRNRLPTDVEIGRAAALAGYQKLVLVPPNRIQLTEAGMRLDFGGIGQGHAVDAVLSILSAAGMESALVDASGDIAVSGAEPGSQKPWIVEIPAVGDAEGCRLEIQNVAVSTSGDIRQSLVLDGIRYSHVVDPRTGCATTHAALATVTALDCTTADALASAFCVLQPEEALKLAESMAGVEARLVVRRPGSPGRLEVLMTSGFGALMSGDPQTR